MTITTIETITDTQIIALRDEAAVAGDLRTVDTCEAALDGDRKALRTCVDIIADAEAAGE